jgi:hypothetical protein
MTPPEVRTSRGLYLYVTGLAERARERSRDDYLSCLWRLGAERRSAGSLTGNELAELLERAMTEEVPGHVPPAPGPARDGFARWEATILYQIHDPGPQRDVVTYLECGLAGTFGGYSRESDTGRVLLPGKQAVLGADGQLHARDPLDVRDETGDLVAITWDRFAKFLENGRDYE